MIKLGSLFDGIGTWQRAATLTGITPLWSSEIDDFCRYITAKHFPHTIQLGDIRGISNPPYVDIITAGFPCQDLSIAGKRAGIRAERSGLFFDAINLIRHIKPKFAVFENVPGLLSSNKGLDFGTVLEQITETKLPLPKRWTNAGVVDCTIGQVAWRILDAQYFGVPQRRRRVFIVSSFGTRRAAKILFESKGLQRDFTPCNCEGLSTTPPPRVSTGKSYGIGRDAFNCGKNAKFNLSFSEELQPPLTARGAGGVFDGYHVRRLTPIECERLQGLPDNWTCGGSDTARYKALGNGMALPVAVWIFNRILRSFYD